VKGIFSKSLYYSTLAGFLVGQTRILEEVYTCFFKNNTL